MHNVFVKQIIYDLSKIEEAELVFPQKEAYNKNNTEVKNNEDSSNLQESS